MPKTSHTPLQVADKPANGSIVVGIDEAGRGPLFGPLVVAAVALDPDRSDDPESMAIRDSKRMSKKKREELEAYILRTCLDHSISVHDNQEIDERNILVATLSGMSRCANDIQQRHRISMILVDGDRFQPIVNRWVDNDDDALLMVPYQLITGGDNKHREIAAASILAKTHHDRLVCQIVQENPDYDHKYNLLSSMGYGTKAHMDGIRTHGLSPHHRTTFCQKVIARCNSD